MPTGQRKFLFLQGPASPFLRRVADRVEQSGFEVEHVSFCLGDWIFWNFRKTIWFKGCPGEWPAFLAQLLTSRGITDLLMLGDGRPVHSEAIDVAFEYGCRVHILEHGYIRPDWLTLEPDGMSGYSRFPKEPFLLRGIAEGLPDPDLLALYRSSFFTYAVYDLIYHLPNVALGWLVHPHYRRHGPVHPLVEYSGWIWKAIKSPWEKHHLETVMQSITASDGPKFLFPLQLPGDYQIKVHAPGGNLFDIVDGVIENFALHAPDNARILFKVHPIDNELSGWHRRIGEAAGRANAKDRVFCVNGGSLDAMIEQSSGIVTVNSTVGITALMARKPVIALGAAIFAMPGLTHQGSLSAFWSHPEAPNPELVDAMLKVLIDRIQVRGGFIGQEAIEAGAQNVAERVTEDTERFPITERRSRTAQHFRYEHELFGERLT